MGTAVEVSVTTANQWIALVSSLIALTTTMVVGLRKLVRLHDQLVANGAEVKALRGAIRKLEHRMDDELGALSEAVAEQGHTLTSALDRFHPEHEPPPRRKFLTRRHKTSVDEM